MNFVSQEIAETIFNFGVNTGTGVAIKLAQVIVGAVPDGGIDPKRLSFLTSVRRRTSWQATRSPKLDDTPPSATKTEGNLNSSSVGSTEPCKDSNNGSARDRLDH